MAAPTNLSFETAGATDGQAASWTIQSLSSFYEYAEVGQDATHLSAYEEFGTGWGASADPFVLTSAAATFGGGFPSERFETWFAALLEGSFVDSDLGGGSPIDPFEAWFAKLTTLSSPVAAVFGGSHAAETFAAAEGWDASFGTTLSSPTAAGFDSVGAAAETFETFIAPMVVIVDVTNNKIVATAHGLTTNWIIFFDTTGLRPGGIQAAPYFADVLDANNLKIKASAAGGDLTLTDVGTGTLTMRRDPAKFWTLAY